LTGTGVSPVTLSATSINFGNVVIGSTSGKQVTLTNNQSVPLNNISLSIIGAAAFSQVNTCGTSIPAGGHCTITVKFTPTSGGKQTATLNIADSASSSPQTVSLTGTGIKTVSLNPGALTFAAQTVGTTSAPKNIVVTNHEKVVVTFTSIAISGANASDFAQTNTCSSLSPGATCTLMVTFTPSAKGARSATLTLTDSATNSPQSANLSGTGQ